MLFRLETLFPPKSRQRKFGTHGIPKEAAVPPSKQETVFSLSEPASCAGPLGPAVTHGQSGYGSEIYQMFGEDASLAKPYLGSVEQPNPSPERSAANNYRLPFDVLVQIFENFAMIEDRKSPLEVLLSICRFWRDTAVDYRTLWTTFRLCITTNADVNYWKTRFPKRADRFGPKSLLDISIVLTNRAVPHSFSFGLSTRYDAHAYAPLRILKVVAGRRGMRAVQWKSLTLDIMHLGGLFDQDYDILAHFLRNRTPNLESVALYGVKTYTPHERVLPYAPKLRMAVLHSCHVSNYPSTDTLTSLTWYLQQEQFVNPLRNTLAIQALKSAQKITFLEIGLDWAYWDTPLLFQRVTTLKMPAIANTELVTLLEVPSLRHLGLGLDGAGNFAIIKYCKGIPCGQIENLELFYAPRPTITDVRELGVYNMAILEGFKTFLPHMTNLRTLSWNESMVSQKELLGLALGLFFGQSVEDYLVQRPGWISREV